MRTEALKEAQRKYFQKKKEDPEFKQKNREYAKKWYASKKNNEDFLEKKRE